MKFGRKFLPYILSLHLMLSGIAHANKTNKNIYVKPLFSSVDVSDPYYAFEPDGKCAKILYLGNLDLEFSEPVENLEGPDIRVVTKAFREYRRFGTRVYQLFAKEREEDEWKWIGTGPVGESWDFDLKGLKRAKYLRIYYKNPYDFIRIPRLVKDEMGVDSVEVVD